MTLAQATAPQPAPVESNTRRVISFDHSFRHELAGRPGQLSRQTATVSVEAAFTAVSIGYGFVPEVDQVTFGPAVVGDLALDPVAIAGLPQNLRNVLIARNAFANTTRALVAARPTATTLASLPGLEREVLVPGMDQLQFGDIVRALARSLGEAGYSARRELGPRTAAALEAGIRLNPEVARFLLQTRGTKLDAGQLRRMFQTVQETTGEVLFLYALADEGTGREFQSEPILGTAGLGSAQGERPFRQFAQPITFAPRTVIRLDVIEAGSARGTLHFSLHGYKVLGGEGTPTGRAMHRRRPRR
jgi:hypothetical protein